MVKQKQMPNEQLPLFPPPGAKSKSRRDSSRIHSAEPLSPNVPLIASSSLAAALGTYYEYMKTRGWSNHTRIAFSADLRLFMSYFGANARLNEITIESVNKYLNWLRYERDVPCSPKSYQRRLTTLKTFFGWLKQTQILGDDPAAPIPHIPVTSPLPTILYDDQIAKLLEAARSALNSEKPDARPLLIATLLLSTGIKKNEAMSLRVRDIDAANPKLASLYIRYDDARKRHKERHLSLSPEFAATLPVYLKQYDPKDKLFEFTPRTLEYVLSDLAKASGLGDTVSFESLRWTCAVQDFKSGIPEDHIRQKLGLSTITWEEDGERLKRLAGKAL